MKKLMTVSIMAILFAISCKEQNTGGNTNLEPVEFAENFKKLDHAVLLDVRTPDEFASGYIEGAVNLDYNDDRFSEAISIMDKTGTYYVYCLSGGRSGSAVDEMKAMGFKNVYNLNGGILNWNKNNMPIANAVSIEGAENELTTSDFKEMVDGDFAVMVDFYAPWCVPCKKMEPVLEKLIVEFDGKVKIIRINVDKHKSLAKELGISELPVVATYKNGNKIEWKLGFLDEQSLRSMLTNL